MSDYVIQTESLQKQYGSRLAVADLTLHVARGEVFGFLGPNGAGKSTAVKMLLGLVRATGGTAHVLGSAPGTPATLRRIGFLPEHFRFPAWLQARELLAFHGRLCGMNNATRRRRTGEVLELVGLAEHARRPLAGFSKGMLQRVGLAQALLHEPELVFLDEPTSALDPLGRRLVRQIVRELKASGTTVFLNSHLLGEVEATCDRVTFIREGRILHTLALDEQADSVLQVELRASAVSRPLLTALEQLTGQTIQHVGPVPTTPNGVPITLELTIHDEALLPQIAACTLHHGAQLYTLTPRRVSLEQRFLDIVGMEDSHQ
jgi:ABC-2 type transport system ATP-binding protein